MLALFQDSFTSLHFQTSKVWPAKLGADTIVVANDAVVGDALRSEFDAHVGPVILRIRNIDY